MTSASKPSPSASGKMPAKVTSRQSRGLFVVLAAMIQLARRWVAGDICDLQPLPGVFGTMRFHRQAVNAMVRLNQRLHRIRFNAWSAASLTATLFVIASKNGTAGAACRPKRPRATAARPLNSAFVPVKKRVKAGTTRPASA